MSTEQATLTVGTRVRNVKTRSVGSVQKIDGDNVVIVLADEVLQACRLNDLELLNVEEYELCQALIAARAEKKRLSDELAKAVTAAFEAEEAMIEYLRTNNLQGTAPYDELGKVEIDGMKVMPSITEANKAEALEAIRAMGRGDIIKEGVHPKTLEAFVSELLDNGQEVPKSIGYFLKPKLSFKKK